MTSRRMLGGDYFDVPHDREHDWIDECDDSPRCTPVDPNHVEPDGDAVAGVGYDGLAFSRSPNESTFSPDVATRVGQNMTYDPPPTHYATGGIDPWTYIEAQQLDYWQGNIVKYITRCGRKDIADKLDDLKKIRNFVNKYIEIEEKKERP